MDGAEQKAGAPPAEFPAESRSRTRTRTPRPRDGARITTTATQVNLLPIATIARAGRAERPTIYKKMHDR